MIEKVLNTHDIAIPLPRMNDEGNYVRMLLLTVSDIKSPDKGWKRIERLYHLHGGHNVGMVLLLAGEDTKDDSVHAYMELQARYVGIQRVPHTGQIVIDLIEVSVIVHRDANHSVIWNRLPADSTLRIPAADATIT